MIVKDEETFLPECLESVRGVVDQMVVVDTGSQDRTVQIAKAAGAEVYSFPWCDDFGAARNESLKYATGDWVLWMDADERLLPESIPELKRLLRFEARPVIYEVQIRNIKEDGETYSLSGAHRLFTNHRGIRFTGRIHEQVSPIAARVKAEERKSGVVLYHLGYGVRGERAEAKTKRNRKLLERMVRESPESAYAHYTLAQHYGLTGKQEAALKHYRVAYRLKQFDADMTASLLNTMSETLIRLGKPEQARKYVTRSIRMKPIQVGGYYLQYKIAVAKQAYEEALRWLEKLLKMNRKVMESRKTISTDVLIDEARILFTIGGIYQQLGRLEEALSQFQQALKHKPDHVQVLEKIVEVLFRMGDFDQAKKYLQRLLELTDGDLRYQELQGLLFIKQEHYRDAIAIYESIFSRQPENVVVARRLAGLYGKIGEIQKAGELLASLPEAKAEAEKDLSVTRWTQ
jgi:tetratricopeptide (TPR) repeat protein